MRPKKRGRKPAAITDLNMFERDAAVFVEKYKLKFNDSEKIKT
jgi:hypothetical protein